MNAWQKSRAQELRAFFPSPVIKGTRQTAVDRIAEAIGGPDAVLEALERAVYEGIDEGYCVTCGSCYGTVEPDARRYPCGECDQKTVYSILEIFV